MKRSPLYSTPRRPEPTRDIAPPMPAAPRKQTGSGLRRRRWLGVGLGLAALIAAVALWRVAPPMSRAPTQKDIDRAVLHTLATHNLPSPAAKAFEQVQGSVVKVIGYSDASEADAKDESKSESRPEAKPDASKIVPRAKPRSAPSEKTPKDSEGEDKLGKGERGVGTGVVIVDNGTILTNLHVVFGAKRIKVIFADGLEADADVVGLQPQNDLAVLRARKIPDDLKAATMRSTADLRPGDRVTAVGFPFGIGPSVSHGVVSGLKREFRSPEGQKILTNLIQFDAAANPGNSGGPLITDDGEVVGIVTAIYNPTQERFFVGIGFAVPIENAAQAAGMPPF
jgi:S1-C subfamily serine protease